MTSHRTNRTRKCFRPRFESLEGRCLLSVASPMPNAASPATGVDVLTYHNDTSRTGANLNETTLTPQNVNATSFGKLFSYKVDGDVYAQPLEVSGLRMGDGKVHNVLVVAPRTTASTPSTPTTRPRARGTTASSAGQLHQPGEGHHARPLPGRGHQRHLSDVRHHRHARHRQVHEHDLRRQRGEAAANQVEWAALRDAIPRPGSHQRQGEERGPGHDRRYDAQPLTALSPTRRPSPSPATGGGSANGVIRVQRAAGAQPARPGARHPGGRGIPPASSSRALPTRGTSSRTTAGSSATTRRRRSSSPSSTATRMAASGGSGRLERPPRSRPTAT